MRVEQQLTNLLSTRRAARFTGQPAWNGALAQNVGRRGKMGALACAVDSFKSDEFSGHRALFLILVDRVVMLIKGL